MQITFALVAGLLSVSHLILPVAAQSANEALLSLTSQALGVLNDTDTSSSKRSTGCSLSQAYARKDWKFLTSAEKTAYITAVKCLMNKPSTADPSFAPGARTRYDDFVAIHINQTLSIHGTGNFLTWHRYYTWAYENALRQECGYEGSQPYWNWFDGSDFANSPVFDGSATS
ncbi:hypothetical protein V8C42DRAFT_111070, partial [Trichoderma barbatum]